MKIGKIKPQRTSQIFSGRRWEVEIVPQDINGHA
jgi:hypothetical protein